MHLTTLLPALLLLLPVTTHPAPAPFPFLSLQSQYDPPVGLQFAKGSPICQKGMTMNCIDDHLICLSSGNWISVAVGKCSECTGSVCAKGAEAYPGDQSTQCEARSRKRGEPPLHVLVEREIMERQAARCNIWWECACVSYDGKGYFTRGKGGQCPGGEGVQAYCTEDGGYLCSFRCASELLKGFTNEKCDALFPGTRAVCRGY